MHGCSSGSEVRSRSWKGGRCRGRRRKRCVDRCLALWLAWQLPHRWKPVRKCAHTSERVGRRVGRAGQGVALGERQGAVAISRHTIRTVGTEEAAALDGRHAATRTRHSSMPCILLVLLFPQQRLHCRHIHTCACGWMGGWVCAGVGVSVFVSVCGRVLMMCMLTLCDISYLFPTALPGKWSGQLTRNSRLSLQTNCSARTKHAIPPCISLCFFLVHEHAPSVSPSVDPSICPSFSHTLPRPARLASHSPSLILSPPPPSPPMSFSHTNSLSLSHFLSLFLSRNRSFYLSTSQAWSKAVR